MNLMDNLVERQTYFGTKIHPWSSQKAQDNALKNLWMVFKKHLCQNLSFAFHEVL